MPTTEKRATMKAASLSEAADTVARYLRDPRAGRRFLDSQAERARLIVETCSRIRICHGDVAAEQWRRAACEFL